MSQKLNLTPSQRALLDELLDRNERSTGKKIVSVRITPDRYPKYFDESEPLAIHSWEDEVRQLTLRGWVEIDFGQGADKHRIARVRLNIERARDLERLLGRLALDTFKTKMSVMLEGFYDKPVPELAAPRWHRLLNDEREYWTGAKIAVVRRADILGERSLVLNALHGLIQRWPEQPGSVQLSWRQFATKIFADSKAVDGLRPQITNLLALYFLDNDWSPSLENDQSAILSHFGIWSKETVAFLRCAVTLTMPGKAEVDTEPWVPFFTIPESLLDRCVVDPKATKGVVTIENEESFHSWVRQRLMPDWTCLYLGGFPTKTKVRFLRKLSGHGLPLFHWGDLDCGGIEILLFLEREVGAQITPVGMSPSWLDHKAEQSRPLNSREVHRIEALLANVDARHPIRPLLEALKAKGRKLEQEAIGNPLDIEMG